MAVLIELLYQKLSYYDDSLSALADGFHVTDTSVYRLSTTSVPDRRFSSDQFLAPHERAAFDLGFTPLKKTYW